MKSQQSGFTLVEIAIVLVIIGLLLGGVLKGQELINSAKVKNLANDFRTVQTFLYGYQDKFRAIPGDDPKADTHLASTGGLLITNGNGDGVINGQFNANAGESFEFWQQVRLAGLAPGSTDKAVPEFTPRNADGGIMGIQSGGAVTVQPIATLRGTYIYCSSGILGKFAKQLDTTLDDGNTATGSVQVRANISDNAPFAVQATGTPTTGVGGIDDATPYTVCMGF